MKHFYQLPTLLLLLLVMAVSLNATAGKEAPLADALAAPGDLSAAIKGDSAFCATSGGVIVFEGAGGNAPYTFTYQVDGGPVLVTSTSGFSNSATVNVNTSVAGEFIYRITSVKGTTGKATPVDISRVITIRKAPEVDFSFPATACSGSMISFTPSVQGAGMYSYLWNFGDGQTSTEQEPSHAFISTGCATASFTVSLTVKDENGCSATRSHSITVLQKPDISFSDLNFPFGEPFSNCGSASAASPDFTVNVGNTSPSESCIASYSINWGDGSAPVSNVSFPASHTYKSLGAFEMVVTAQGANGCSNTITYVVRNLNNPSVGITSPGTTTNLCATTAPLEFEIAKWGTNPPGTTYRVNYGDGSAVITYTQEQLQASDYYNKDNPSASANYPIPHSYDKPNCPNGPYIVRLTATNACSSTEATVNNITVFNKTTPDFTVAAHACVNSSVAIINTSIPGYNTSCTQTSIYTWDFGDGSTQSGTSPTLPKNTSHTYTTPGQYTIRLSVKNICGEAVKTQVITIDPPLTAKVSGSGMVSGTVNACQDAAMPVITFTGSNGTAPYTFTYKINNGPLLTVTTPEGSNSATVTVPTTATGSFTYTLVNISDASPTACTQVQTGAVTVVISAPPTGTISGNLSACIDDASPQITLTGTGGTRPYLFTYTINGGEEQTISSDASSNSVTLFVPTNVAGVFKYKLIGVKDSGAAACTGNVDATTTVNIYPRPAPMTLANYEYCNGEVTSVISFSNAIAGTTYKWSNSNPSIGLGTSGTGNIPSFTARNTTSAPVTATITVTPSVNGCDGASQTFVITVYPSAVLFSQGAQTICSGDQTTQVTLSSPAGAAVSWSAVLPAGITGAVTSGANTIPVQTLVNTTSAPLKITYTATAALPVNDPCAGTSYSYTITVNPRPAIQQAFDTEICSGGTFSVSPQVNAENSIPSGTKYTWSAPVVNLSGAITGASAQAAPQASIGQTLVNTTSTTATATYTVIPVANGCAGDPFTIVVTVLPLPKATVAGGTTVCQNAAMPVITFTGSGGTAPYTFSYRMNGGAVNNITTTSGNSVTVEVPTDKAGSYTYTLVSVQDKGGEGCLQAQAGSVTVVVSAPPSATIAGSATVCLNEASPAITFTGSGGTRPYTFTYIIDGGAAKSIRTDGTSNSATIFVSTTTAGTYRVNLIAVKDSTVNACSRALNAEATVTVKELPAAMTLADYEYCNGQITSGIIFTNAVAGTTYRWTNSNPSIGLPASGTGSISSFTALNATALPISSTVTVIPSLNGCDGAAQSFKITVLPSPAVTFSSASQTLCSGDSTLSVTLSSSTPGVQFDWTAVQPAGVTGVITSGTNTIPVQSLVNTTSAPITVIYRAKASTSGPVSCSGAEATYSITVNPRAEIKETFARNICSGSAFTVSPQNGSDNSIPDGTKYTWGAPVISPVGAVTGASAQAVSQSIISQILVNTTTAPATVTYTVNPVSNGCAGESFIIEVTVLPLPTAKVSGSTTVCQDAPMPWVTFTGANGMAPYTFTYLVNGVQKSITTDEGSDSVTVNVPTGVAGSYTYTLVSVQDKGGAGCIQSQSGSAEILVRPLPSAAILGDATVCTNDASAVITFTGSGGTNPYTFTYTINGGEAKIIRTEGTSNSATVAVPTTAGIYEYNLTAVQDSTIAACRRNLNASAKVTVNELPAAITLADYEFCNGQTTSVINFTNAVEGVTYSWSSSNPSIGLMASGKDSIPSFTALNSSSSAITSLITVIPSVNGCIGASQSFRITVQPSPVITFSMGSQTICSGESTSEVVLSSNTTDVQFSWTAVSPAGVTGVVTSGTNTIPVQGLVNTTSAPITVIYSVKASITGNMSCSGSEATYSITVNPKPAVLQAFVTEICSGSTFTVSPQNGSDNSIPLNTQYTWSAPIVSPVGSVTGAGKQSTPQANISQTLVNTTSAPATVTYAVTPVANGCAGDPFTIEVTILPLPTAMVSGSTMVCQGGAMPAITFTAANGITPYIFNYKINDGPLHTAQTELGSNSVTVPVSTDVPGTFTYTLVSVMGDGPTSCTQIQGGSATVVVNALPSGTISGSATVCINDPSPVITFTGSNGIKPYTFTYTINGGEELSISTKGTSNSVTLNVPTAAADTFTYHLTSVQDSTTGSCSTGVDALAMVTINPLPASMNLPDYTFCNGETTSVIAFSNAVAGTTYRWSSSNPIIGIPASGPDSISSFTALNSSSSAITSVITVIPSVNGCIGASQSFRITVQPSPVVTFSMGSQTICSGDQTKEVTLGSSTQGVQFSCNAVQPEGITGVMTGSANTIPVQTLVNTTDAPLTVTYKVKAATTGAAGCWGNEYSYSITVNPSPQVNESFATEVCSGNTFTVSPQNNAQNRIPSEISYTWSAPVIAPAGSIAGAGAQATPQANISQTLVNTTSVVATATYTVTPLANGCAGAPFTVVVKVFPIISVNPLSDLTLCSGEQVAAIVFSGNVPGTLYSWTSDNSFTGIAGSGSDSIASFTAINTGNSPVRSTVTVTPIFFNGSIPCEGTPGQFILTVNPKAQVNPVEDQKACSGSRVSVSFSTQNTQGSTSYEWTNSNTAIGLSASGTGNLSFTPVNTGSASLKAVITVTSVYAYNGASCKGEAQTFTVEVEPEATMVKPQDQVVCNGHLTGEILFTANSSDVVYRWINNNPSIGLPAAGSGAIMPFMAVNNGEAPETATITVTPVVNGCSGTPASFAITVNPTPEMITQPEGGIVCLGQKPAPLNVAVKGAGSVSYQWYSHTDSMNTGGVLIPNANSASFDPPADAPGTFYYYCQILFDNDCNELFSAPAGVTITPNPVISAIDQEISSGESFTVIPTWGNGNIIPAGTAYIWSAPTVSPAGAVAGASAQAVPQEVISQRLVNTTPQPATVTYTVFPISGACTGASFKVTVYVDAPLIPNMTITPVACYGMNNGSITTQIQGGAPFAQGAPYTVLWTGPNGYTSSDTSIHDLAPGIYHLSVTDSRGKQLSAETTILSTEELMVVPDDKSDVSCYGAKDGHISITAQGGTQPYQIEWTKDMQPFAVTEDIAGLAPGTYQVTVRDANGCVPAIMSWIIAQPDPLIVNLTGKSDIRCFGDSSGYIAVEVTGGVPLYHYRWTGPEGFTSADKDLSRLAAGDYSLVVTDRAGCTQSLAVTLTEPSPLAVETQTTPISCYGANNATIRLDVTGGTPPYQADWNNYASGTYQDNLSAGVYTILITDANQCQITTTVKIPEAPVFKMNPEVKNVSCYGARNGSISLNFETTLKSIILTWSDNVRSGTTRNNIGPGVYTVNIQGESLCALNRTFVITEPAPLTLTAKVTDITDCNSVDGGAIDLVVAGGNAPYRYSWSNGAVTQDVANLTAGSYAITVTDSMGCAQMALYTVKRPAPLVIDVKTNIDFNCAGGDIKAVNTAKISGGVTPYQLRWSTGDVSGQNNEQMETRQSGIVILTVTDQSGCTATRSFNIDLPVPGIISQVTDCNAHVFQFNGTPAIESEATTYRWDFGDGTVSDLRNPQHTYAAAGTYNIRLTIAAGACITVYDEVVDAALPPVIGIDKEPRFCPGDSILIYGTGADTYRWNDGSKGDSIWISREGDYSVTGTSAAGCQATFNFRASYYDLIGYTIHSDQQEVSAGASRIHFWSEDIPYSAYRWDFGDGQSGQGAETFHSYEISEDGYFDVSLTVINPNGCEEKAVKRIWKSVTAIANTFTPNSDGFNDIYLKGWQIQVFNRNGILMYQGDTGWDGKHDGRPVDNDTYFVIIYDSTQMGAKYKTGYVTVLR